MLKPESLNVVESLAAEAFGRSSALHQVFETNKKKSGIDREDLRELVAQLRDVVSSTGKQHSYHQMFSAILDAAWKHYKPNLAIMLTARLWGPLRVAEWSLSRLIIHLPGIEVKREASDTLSVSGLNEEEKSFIEVTAQRLARELKSTANIERPIEGTLRVKFF